MSGVQTAWDSKDWWQPRTKGVLSPENAASWSAAAAEAEMAELFREDIEWGKSNPCHLGVRETPEEREERIMKAIRQIGRP
jgi:hypothetical protein